VVTNLLQNKGLVGVGKTSGEETSLRKGLEECRQITRKYGTSFYFATQFFPKEIKEAIYAVYAFARIPDEIVDDPNKSDKKTTVAKLEAWRQKWLRAMESGESDDSIMVAIVSKFKKHGITVEDGEAFLKSMFLDEEKFTYSNYKQLDEYMYGSAGVIGLMVTKIVGYHSAAAFPYAIRLGYAFQLTNFLRDIKQDSEELKRIYMPLDELARHGISYDDIWSSKYDHKFVEFMKFQISRNREVYREALPGIKLLKWRGRLAVRISYVLYKEILAEIERADYNVYKGRVRTNFKQKLWLSAKALIGIYE